MPWIFQVICFLMRVAQKKTSSFWEEAANQLPLTIKPYHHNKCNIFFRKNRTGFIYFHWCL